MKQTLYVFLGGFLLLASCKLAEPVGYNAYSKSASNEKNNFIEGVNVEVGSTKTISNNSEITPTYTKKQLAEEKSLTSYSIFNIPETFRQLTKRSQNLYSFIDNWYGTPYRFGGTTRRGIDCSAFMQEIFNGVYKYRLPRTSRDQFAISKKINRQEDLREGDLVFFKIRTSSISHVGIYLADGKFAHASSSKGVIISNLGENYWSRYYAGGGRVEEAVYAFR